MMWHRNRAVRAVVVAVAVLALGACGDAGSPTGGATGASDGNQGSGNEGGGNNQPEFNFDLPVGEVGIDAAESEIYEPLRRGECDNAQQRLDGSTDNPESALWRNFHNPRNVLLFQAGIELCRKHRDEAQRWYDRAEREYGWGDTNRPKVCPMYQVTSSVLRHRPPSDFGCQGGTTKPWVENPETFARDDPRTPQNEAAETPSTSDSPID